MPKVRAICPIRCVWGLRPGGVAPAGLTHTDAPSLPQMLGFSFFAATLGKRLTPKPEFPKEKNAFPMYARWLDLASDIMLQHRSHPGREAGGSGMGGIFRWW